MKPAPSKFLFDNDFANSGSGGKPTIALAEHAAKLKEAEAAAYAAGFAAAQAEVKAESERRSAAAFERIAGALETLNSNISATEVRFETEAVEVAVAVGKKLAAELIAREPFAEISALAASCFRHLVAAPHIVVRVNDIEKSVATTKLEEFVRTNGLESRLVVLAEPDIAPGDCRIEWADGGMARDRAAIELAIDEAVGRYIGARRGSPSAARIQEVNWRPNR